MEVAGAANELIDDNFHTSFCQSLDKTVISVMTTIKFQHASTAITTYGFYSQEAADYMADNNYAEDFDLVAGNNATYIGSEYWSFRGRRNKNTVFYDYTYFSSPSPICLMLLNTQHSQRTQTQIPQHQLQTLLTSIVGLICTYYNKKLFVSNAYEHYSSVSGFSGSTSRSILKGDLSCTVQTDTGTLLHFQDTDSTLMVLDTIRILLSVRQIQKKNLATR